MAYARACVYAWDLSSRGLNRFRWKNSIESIRYFSFFFFKGNDRSRKIFVRVVSFELGGGSGKGKKIFGSDGTMVLWICDNRGNADERRGTKQRN